ncbi:MAG: orotidine-5'-phosphate decarboxylase [Sandaracinaceae bacterium]
MHRARARDRLAFALDVATLRGGRMLLERLRGEVGVIKVGLELFTASGPAAIEAVHEADAKCFLDLKLHDIPNTMARAAQAAASHGVRYLTVHAAAGPAALEKTARAVEGTTTQLLAVTVLTSMDEGELGHSGIDSAPAALVERRVRMATEAGVRGFVCSAHEAERVRELAGPRCVVVTPGIRPAGADVGDQRRVATPATAIRAGASLLVVGRPIREANDPADAARRIVAEIAAAGG